MDSYLQIKEESLKGNITDKLFPYLWEYYEDICTNKLVTQYDKFVQYFSQYLNTPVLMINGSVIMPMETFSRKLPDIFKHLDIKYKQPQQEATEK